MAKNRKGDYVEENFGGMCITRPFDENIDGWRNEMIDSSHLPIIAALPSMFKTEPL
jgi:hypothetical protein